MAQINFDANTVAPNSGQPDPVPSDWYKASIDESEMKPTKDGTGTFLQLRYAIIEGAYKGRKVYARLNLRNQSAQAQEIGFAELSAVCHATGVMQLQDSQQLHNIPVNLKVKLRPADGEYDATNEVKAVKHISEQVGNPTTSAPAYQAPASGSPAYTAPPQQQAPVQQQPWQQPQQQPQPQQQQQVPVNQNQTWQQPNQSQPWQQAPVQQAPVQQPPQQAPVQQQQQQQQPPTAGTQAPPWAVGQPQ